MSCRASCRRSSFGSRIGLIPEIVRKCRRKVVRLMFARSASASTRISSAKCCRFHITACAMSRPAQSFAPGRSHSPDTARRPGWYPCGPANNRSTISREISGASRGSSAGSSSSATSNQPVQRIWYRGIWPLPSGLCREIASDGVDQQALGPAPHSPPRGIYAVFPRGIYAAFQTSPLPSVTPCPPSLLACPHARSS